MTSSKLREFSERFVKDQHKVFGYVLTMIPNRNDAEEIFQQTSLTLWERWEDFDTERSFLSWACGIARNHVFNFLRVRSHQRHMYLPDDLLEDMGKRLIDADEQHDERRAALSACLDELTGDQRKLVEHRYGTQRSLVQLAGDLSLTPNALYKSIGRVRQVLFDCITRRTESGGVSGGAS